MYSRGSNSSRFDDRTEAGPAPAACCRRQPRRTRGRGFTMIELLIVVVILGILATIVVPQFSTASANAKESALKDDLRYLRTQIVVYRAQHHDCPPGYPNGDREQAATGPDFVAQMTKPSDEDGITAAQTSPVYKLGPYLSAMPVNPLSGLSAVQIVGDGEPMPEPTGADYGWFYKPLTGEIIANSVGSDASGNAYKNY
jgi:prepilin-type N-terminal cleavage/methylation domain-containing protein